MDKAQFTSRLKGKIVLADFSAAWCGPCRAMAPVIEALKKDYQGRALILEIDIDNAQQLATDFMVHSIPTLILFRDGKEIRRFVGLQSRTAIEQGLNALL